MIESELFGHIRGAFTEARQEKKGRLEFAHSGVPFLDEIGDIDSELQPKLLRFLDSGELYLDYIQHIGRTESLAAAPVETTADSIPRPLRAVVDPVERAHIERTLEFAKGNKRKAIEILEISSDTFYKRLKEFGLY